MDTVFPSTGNTGRLKIWDSNPETYHCTITKDSFFQIRGLVLSSPYYLLGRVNAFEANVYLIRTDGELIQVFGDPTIGMVGFDYMYTKDLPAGEYTGLRIEVKALPHLFCEIRNWLMITVS